MHEELSMAVKKITQFPKKSVYFFEAPGKSKSIIKTVLRTVKQIKKKSLIKNFKNQVHRHFSIGP